MDSNAMQATLVKPHTVVETKDIVIKEYHGRIASREPRISACVVDVKTASEEAWQTPGFDEWVMVLEGEVHLLHSDGKKVVITAGNGAFLPKGLRVKWIWPGPCKYVPICLPAFSTENCGREDEEGNHHAKSGEAMKKLRVMHAEKKYPWVFHVARKERWEAAKASGEMYYPPTYKQDGITHGTSNASLLCDVLNHFYKDVKDEYVCLRFTKEGMKKVGIDVIFEGTVAVGDTQCIDVGDELFPHIMGGIPSKGVVLEEHPVIRGDDGTFLEIPGINEGERVFEAS